MTALDSAAMTARMASSIASRVPYDICYLRNDGSLARKVTAECESELKAKILAHALREEGTAQIEVWSRGALIYSRPEKPEELDAF